MSDGTRRLRRGEALESLEDPEFIARVSRVVAELNEPQAIPALAGALGTGFTVIRTPLGVRPAGRPAVLAVVTSPASMPDAVNHVLITLRLMVEEASLSIRPSGWLPTDSPASLHCRGHDQKLRLDRAESVKRYLYEQHQVPLHKISVISYGEEKPIAPNKTGCHAGMTGVGQPRQTSADTCSGVTVSQ